MREVEVPRPLQALRAWTKQYPTLGAAIDLLRLRQGKTFPRWPAHVFVPMVGIYAFLDGAAQQAGKRLRDEIVHSPLIPMLTGLWSWRVTQGIYDFDATVFEELWHTPVTGQLPTRVLLHLPEWCCYVRFPMPIGSQEASLVVDGVDSPTHTPVTFFGFFVYHEWAYQEKEQYELRFLLDLQTTDRNMLVPQAVPLGAWDLEEACNRAMQFSLDHLAHMPGLQQDQDLAARVVRSRHYLMSLNAPLLSLTLYLCSLAAEFRAGALQRPLLPGPSRTKKGPRFFPPAQPTVWAVAERTGAQLRLAQARVTGVLPSAGEGEAARARPLPHIRRAHWHTYLTGPGRTVPRVRWLHPILVGGTDVEQLIPTARPVD